MGAALPLQRVGRAGRWPVPQASAIGLGLGCLAGVAVVVAATSVEGYAAGSPLTPPGAWRAALIVAAVAAFACYVVGVWLLARRPQHPSWVFGLAAVIQLLPLAGPLLLSRDALIYNALGTLPHPFSSRAQFGGGETYGPAWQLVSQPLARLDGGQSDGGAYAFRVLAAASMIVILAIVWQLAERKSLAVALVGWNPLLALHYAGGGHNDALMMAFVAAALLLMARGTTNVGGASWVLAVAIKWSAAWFLLLWAIERLRQRKPIGWAGLLAAAGVVIVTATAIFGTAWPHALRNLSDQERLDHPSLGMLGWIEDTGLSRHPALAVVTLMQVATLGVFMVIAWRKRLRLGLASAFLVIAAPRIDPWYLLWPVTLTAADDEGRWGRVLVLALTGFFLLDVFSYAIAS